MEELRNPTLVFEAKQKRETILPFNEYMQGINMLSLDDYIKIVKYRQKFGDTEIDGSTLEEIGVKAGQIGRAKMQERFLDVYKFIVDIIKSYQCEM